MLHQGWIRKIVEILDPDIIIIYSVNMDDSTWVYFKDLENGIIDGLTLIDPRYGFLYRGEINLHGQNQNIHPIIFATPHMAYFLFHNLFSEFHPDLTFQERMDALLTLYRTILEETNFN